MQIIIHKYITFYINNYLKHKFLKKEFLGQRHVLS